MKTATYRTLLKSVSRNDIGRDEESLNVFEWMLEDHYEAKVKQHLELFRLRPDLYHIANEQLMYEFDKMLNHFVELEEYEKCAKILNTKQDIEKIIKKQV